ncbi:trichohyalin-like [Plakobranchus ocellatus]|uniref:Trichohyalin-like n=1 Tax=Plakobranchus ocellatus TaxID=259542 RepID=A0AAV4D9Z0_9GAST|nr:trichohyalin-like [Plakobranchus ocellatus]
MEQELLDQDLDQNEVQETHEINQVIAKKESEAMQKAVERQTEKLEDVLGLTASEADKIIRLHKMQMEDYNARCQKARQATLVQLQEKLKQRMVGQARRKAILKKQDATLRGLQEQFENRLLTDKSLPTNMTSQIIQEHYNKVTHINDQMQKRREMQQRFIMEKLESKRVELEEQVESQLERDAQEEYTERQKKGAGYASLALMQTFLEQKHAKAMLDLESEMHAELEKSKSELNIQLEQELLHELESRSKEFLQHLASVSKMSKEDLKEAVSAATSGHPRSQAVERLAKDLRQGVETDYAERKRKPSANDRPYSGTASSDLRREWSGKASSQRRSSQLSREEYDDNYGTF